MAKRFLNFSPDSLIRNQTKSRDDSTNRTTYITNPQRVVKSLNFYTKNSCKELNLKTYALSRSHLTYGHIGIVGIGLELNCNGGSCGGKSFAVADSPHKPQFQASSSPIPNTNI